MKILGIESSCDETAFAVVDENGRVFSNAIASQVDLHARYGGVVPEIASRAHLESCVAMHHRALADAGATLAEIDAISVTRGPGLAGCLLVGVEYGKGLALRHGKPLVGVHHIAGHLYSVFLGREADAWGRDVREPLAHIEPYVALVVSGGHSSLVHVTGEAEYTIMGETLDDAVGEAYDKVAKLLGLGYPGGPLLDKLAATGNPKRFPFPLPLSTYAGYDFSFSGLKAAVARLVEKERASAKQGLALDGGFVADIAASFQSTAVRFLISRSQRAVEALGVRRLAITGGVACNHGLRAAIREAMPGVQIAIPEPQYCTDNAAMIAGLGARLHAKGHIASLSLNASPSLPLAAGAGGWNA